MTLHTSACFQKQPELWQPSVGSAGAALGGGGMTQELSAGKPAAGEPTGHPAGREGRRERAVLQIRGVCGRSSDDPCSPPPIGLAFPGRVSGPSLSSLHAAWCRRGRSRPPPVLSLCPPAPGPRHGDKSHRTAAPRSPDREDDAAAREPALEAGGRGGAALSAAGCAPGALGFFSVAPAVLAALAPRPRPCGASPFEPELRGALR